MLLLLTILGFSYAESLGNALQNLGNSISSFGQILNNNNTNSNQCNTPPGWQNGNKRGFVNGLPPGLAKKGLTKNNCIDTQEHPNIDKNKLLPHPPYRPYR